MSLGYFLTTLALGSEDYERLFLSTQSVADLGWIFTGQNEQNTSNKTRGIIKTRGKDPALDIVIVLS